MIYAKTESGKSALQDKSLGLTPKQRSAFIMFDGKRSVEDVLQLTLALGVTGDDLNRLVALGLLMPLDGGMAPRPTIQNVSTPTLPQSGATPEPPPSQPGGRAAATSDQAQYAKAYPIAVRLTSNLGLRGFRLNLAVESSRDLEALKDLGPKIKDAVGVDKFRELEDALYR